MKTRPFHHQRPLAAAAAAYGLGVWAGVRFSWRPLAAATGWLACVLAAVLLPRLHRKRIVGWMGVMLFTGMLLAGSAAHPVTPPEGKYRVEGVLSADAQARDSGTAAVYLENARVQSGGMSWNLGRVYWTFAPDEQMPLREGDAVSFSALLYLPNGQVNPYGFDFRLFLLQKGAACGVSGFQEGQVTGHPGRGLRSVTYHVRTWLDDRVQAVFGAGSALPEALLLGIRDSLPQETVRRFSQAGVAHLLAVSGLHVALLAGALLLPLRRLLGRRASLAVTGVFLLFYCALLDFSAPVVRASLLLLFGGARRLFRRQPDGLTALSAAFLLILLLRPLDLFSASFQLSFGAVLGLVMLAPEIQRRVAKIRNGRWLRMLSNTWAAFAGVAVPTIQIYHRLSLVGLLINPLACVLFSVLLPLYGVVLAAGCVWLPAGQFLAGPVNAVSAWVLGVIEALGTLPFAAVRVPFLPWYCMGAAVLSLLLATRFTLGNRRIKAAAAAALLALSFGVWRLTLNRNVRYLQLAMGQADAALILEDGETAVIDTGGYGGDLASYLLSTGRQADHLILTHLHSDHCMGIRQLLDQRVPIGRVYLPEGAMDMQIDGECAELIRELEQLGVPVTTVHAGDTLAFGRVRGTVTWPEEGGTQPGQDANRYSMAVLWNLDGVRFLTAGDLSGTFENYAARDAEVLKAAHHGSKNSTGDAFLDTVTPDLVLITGGGRANLPHPQMLSRLETRGIPWYDTDRWGALTVEVKDGQAALTPYLSRKEH